MRSRGFNKRISIYETTPVSDGFGGNTVTDALLVTTWANIKTFSINSRNTTDLGVIDLNNSIIVKTRKRNDLTYNIQTQYIIYRDEKYTIVSYPVNVDFEDNTIQFIATRDSLKLTNTIDPPA